MPKASKRSATERTVAQSARELVRGMAGGLIVGLPLLFTMEMWFHSFLLPWWKILVLLAVSFVIVVGYNSVSGFRRERNATELIVDSVETMGVAAVVAGLAMLVLGRIELDTSLRDAAGKVALEMIPVAFGVSLAANELAARPGDSNEDVEPRGAKGPFARLFVAAGAALLFALNVAPTEEPMLLGLEAGPWLLLAAMALSLTVTFTIVFYADFRGGRSLAGATGGPLERPLGETVAAYAISLLISLLLLWAFGRTDGASADSILGQVVMLAVVASFGAALGRLLVGGPATEDTG